MLFQGKDLEAGDYVAFRSNEVPLPEVQAVVIEVKDGMLMVLSTLLAPFQHSGNFPEASVEDLMVVHPADVAIPQESGDKAFAKNQPVRVATGDGLEHAGNVVAAFDGVVVMRKDDGKYVTGGASFFHAAT